MHIIVVCGTRAKRAHEASKINYVLNYYFLIHCKLFIILIVSNGANEKKNTQAKEGLKEKTFKLKFFSQLFRRSQTIVFLTK